MPEQPEKAVAKGSLLGSVQTRNVFYAFLNAQTDGDCEGLWDGYLTDFYDPILGFMSGSFRINSYERYHWNGTNWIFDSERPLTVVGESGDAALPNLLAGVIVAKVTGHRSFARKFISGIAKTNYSDNALSAGAIAAFLQSALAFITPRYSNLVNTLTPGLWLKTHVVSPFVSGQVAAFLGTMRRRKPGLGI